MKTIACISAKGGVGKTLTAINLAASLNFFGRNAIVVDANLSTPNIGLYLGVPIVPVTLHHVLHNKNHITEAIYEHPSGTKVIPGSLSLNDLNNIKPEKLRKALSKLHGLVDYVILDASAGIGRETLAAIEAADELLVVTNPELPAVTDALKAVRVAETLGKPVRGIVLTRTQNDNFDMSITNIEKLTDYPIIGIIPEDKYIRKSLVNHNTVIDLYPKSVSAVSYKQLAASLLGIRYNEQYKEQKSFLRKFLDLLKIDSNFKR